MERPAATLVTETAPGPLQVTLTTGRTENLAVVITDWDALPLLLTAEEAAQVGRVGIYLIREGIRAKQIPHVYFGRIPRIPRDAFRAWIEGRELQPVVVPLTVPGEGNAPAALSHAA